MSTRLLPVLLVLLGPSCTTGVPDEKEPPVTVAPPTPTPYLGPRPPSPPDPCAHGMPIQVHGWTITAPVPCIPLWVDKGDPPPERLGAPEPDERALGTPLSRSAPAVPARVRAVR